MSIFIQFGQKIIGRFTLFSKRLRNRIPEGLVDFTQRRIIPYLAITLVFAFTLLANVAKAAETANIYRPSAELMDLSPAEVAQVVSEIGPYTAAGVIEQDPVTVALAMQDSSFLDKPVLTVTNVTAAPQPTPSAPAKRTATITYTVVAGDTLSSIGWRYGLKIATIKAANNLTSDLVRPGQQLKLPPQDLSPAQLANLQKKKVAGATVRTAPGSKNNAYPYGWCTYYVATRRYVPGGWGNARSWLASARRSGYATGSEPAVGAIVVLNESWMGHVAYVEAVSGGRITISEMNYTGWGIVDRRTLPAHGGLIMGYIY
jgi:surface antigen